MDTAGDLSIHNPRRLPWAYNGGYLCAAGILGAYRIAIIATTFTPRCVRVMAWGGGGGGGGGGVGMNPGLGGAGGVGGAGYMVVISW